MTALLLLSGAALAGAALVRLAFGRWLTRAEQALWGLAVGWSLSALAAYAVARCVGRLSFGWMSAVAFAVCLAALFLWLPCLKNLRRGVAVNFGSLWRREHAWPLAIVALFAPVYLRLYWTHMLRGGSDGLYSGGSAWYDMGLHLALSASFLYGQNFPPVYTPLPPEPLLYPPVPDFQTALLVSLGMSTRGALLVTSLPLALALTGIFYSFARRTLDIRSATNETAPEAIPNASRLTPNPQAPAALATFLFLLNGGLGFLYFFQDWRQSGKTLSQFWLPLEVNYANMGGRAIQWTNLITDTLLPQRASLFGLSLALIVLTAFARVWKSWSGVENKKSWTGWRVLLPAGVLTGLLPFFHTHSYAAVGLVSGFLFLLRPRRAWLAFWTPAVLLAAPHFLHLAGHVSAEGFMRLQPGWRGHNASFWPLYWVLNAGLPTLLIIPAWLAAPRNLKIFYLAFLALLAFALVVVVSPNDYDNIKLMYYWHAANSVLVAAWLVRLATRYRQRFVACLLTLASVASGVLALQHEHTQRKLFFNHEELKAAAFVREHAAPRALFLTAPTIHQPVLSLAGRPVLRGDTAWLWSHGYEFRAREADVKAVYAGREDALELLRYYRVDFIYLGPRERADLRADQSFFDRRFPVFYRGAQITIYDARPPELRSSTADADYEAKLLAPLPPREFAARLDRDPYQLLVEFPRAAFAVYRFYKVAYGRRPRYEEFMSDMRAVGRGLYVGAPGWEKVLEDTKRALTDSFAERHDFKSSHEGRTAAQYVDALYLNAGVVPSSAERAANINALTSGADTHMGLVRRVAENRALYRREYNAAYVLAHYFGYLRRDPDAPPDTNLDGFNFWLTDLDRTHDYRSLSRVFIESGEYRDQVKR